MMPCCDPEAVTIDLPPSAWRSCFELPSLAFGGSGML